MGRAAQTARGIPKSLTPVRVGADHLHAGTDAGDRLAGTDAMILLTRLNGDETYLNPDLIERIEATPDTVVSLVDGKKYVAVEEPHELISRIVAFRAAVLVAAEAEAEAGRTHTSSFGTLTPPRPLRLIEDTTSE
jgi:flagellar protein FlbD